MKRIQVLDCTLRDGGYCNDWTFGNEETKKIIKGLVESNIDIIECGFLTNRVEYNPNVTKFTKIEEIATVIPYNREGKMFVCMINYGEYDVNDLPIYDGSSVDGIRVAFHKSQIEGALDACRIIKEKGYKAFVQPMVSLGYSDKEFINLIHASNDIKPYAFYIVDSFGVMKKKDLIRLYYMVEHNLDESIYIGYHSHNNMQLAYSNAQALVEFKTKRKLIVDSSIFGMGRGAGNLNTELFVEYLNDNIESSYNLKPLLTIIDEILNRFYETNYWGYSLPNYLSASYNTHPNYAQFLCDKNTLTLEAMNDILAKMDDEKRSNYDKSYMQQIYVDYLTTNELQTRSLSEFKKTIKNKKILLIAPGKSAIDEVEKIKKFIAENDAIKISINFDYEQVETDYVFISNARRFKILEESKKSKCIVTSNIVTDHVFLQTNIERLLNNNEMVRDNAGMMAIKFFINLGLSEIYLAGFDGYSNNAINNYIDEKMLMANKSAVIETMNRGMSNTLCQYEEEITINFVTTPKYIGKRCEANNG